MATKAVLTGKPIIIYDFSFRSRSGQDPQKKESDPYPTVMDPTDQGSSNYKKDSSHGSQMWICDLRILFFFYLFHVSIAVRFDSLGSRIRILSFWILWIPRPYILTWTNNTDNSLKPNIALYNL